MKDSLSGPSRAALIRLPRRDLAGDLEDLSPSGEEPAGELAPLSHGQRSLWFLHHLAPADSTYNIAAATRLRAPVDAAALERALRALVDRHAALRTTFPVLDGEPRQRIAGRLDFALTREEAAGWSEERLRSRLAEEAWRPFDLERGPLLRVTLFTGGDSGGGGTVLLLVIHHIVADFWSLAVLMRELPALYREAAGGGPAGLPAASLEYAEHVRLEREALSGDRGEALLAYWRQRLAGLPTLEMATDRPRPAVQTYHGDVHQLRLPADLAAALRAASRTRHATLFMTLVAALQTLLSRHTGQEDLAIGSPRAGRSQSKFAGTVGYFVNPVVLRGDLAGDPSFAELLERTKASVAAAFEHGDYPLPLLAERLQPVRDASRTPLFQVSFVLQKETRGAEGLTAFALGEEGVELDLGDLQLESLAIRRPPAPFDLQLHCVERHGGLSLALQYNTGLFDAATAAHLMDRFAVLLRSIVRDPDLPLSALAVLPEAERGQLLAWNDTAGPGCELNVFELFAAQVARTPGAEAVAFEGERLTYRELHDRAVALAHRLVALGVGPEVLVGVAEERSLELLIGLLAVLAAGGAYVPLEPSLPAQRLAMVLEDARPAVLLTRPAHAEALGLGAGGARLVWLDGVAEPPEPAAAADPLPRADADNAAYVIFTSGSTGRPKGVVNRHRGIVNRLLWMQDAFGLDAGDVFVQKTPFGFDVSVPELFGPLMLGARLVVARPEGHKDSAYLVDLVRREGITTIHFVPSMLPFFLDEEGVAGCRTLRRVLASGEALPWEAEQRCLEVIPAPLINLYGPTEAAVEVTAWFCQPSPRPRPVPIGRPILNTRIHIVGRRLELSPSGAVGELAIGGVQVARGYLGRPELTAERFVPDPHGGEPGARMYRTGDLCRHLPGGEIEYLGRLDDQVKIRGFRIEPREIEIALTAHPAVREAAVVVREEKGAERSLLACVVLAAVEPDAAPAAPAAVAAMLRDHLAALLPPYMVPVFAFGGELDRLPNGKLDRRALSRWLPVAVSARAVTAPRTPLEELLAGVFAEVLGVERIGADDNFFEHGGHSLAAMRLLARVREAVGVDLPLHRVFETPTVAELARTIEGAARSDAPPLVPTSRTAAPLPLSFAQQRLWFLHQLEPASAAYNIPAAIHLRGALDPAALAAALSEVARRQESLRTRFAAGRDEPVQVVDPPAPVAVPRIDLAGLPAGRRLEEARRLARAEALIPFDLGVGRLLRASLVGLDADEQLLLLTMHHVISDGWSLRVLAHELGELYGAAAAGRPSPLPEPGIQYGDYAVWQRRWLQGDLLAAEIAHWRTRLAGAPPVLNLPLDHPRAAVASDRGGSRAVELPPEGLRDLRTLARRHGVTLFMAVLAAFQALLSRLSGDEDVSVGTPVAGRGQIQTEGLIGFFVNTLVIRTDLSGEPTFAALLARVREAALAAYAHQEVPFEKLVEELQPRRELSVSPLFQVSFTLDDEARPSLRLGEIEGELWPAAQETEKFDLSLTLRTGDEGLAGTLGFREDLFEGATIERMAGYFPRLLAGVMADPRLRLPDLPLLSEAEREQLLVGFNDTGKTTGPDVTLAELFAAQAARTPERIALVAPGGVRLTYRELDERAGRLALRLRALGLGPEVLAGVLMDRTAELIVALLAIHKAGGAYAPLDPNYPRQRVLLMLETARARVLVTRRHLAETLGEELPAGLQTVFLDPGWENESVETGEFQPALPDNLAYLIFTSGSTGVPKGVAIQHRSAVAMVRWCHQMFGAEEYAGLLVSTSICFDMSVFEIFATLAAGGKLLLAENALALPDLEAKDEVVLVDTVPSAMAELLRLGRLPASIRTVNLGGEPVKASLVRDLYDKLPNLERVVNLYGPSEDTTFTSYAVLPRGDQHPLIGRPLTGESAYVLDGEMRPVPLGVPGALYLGGEGVTRGYLGRPELTAERYIPNPYGPAGSRLYQVGDLVRYLPTGELDFLGRLDHQVKVRGFRIELGEIESALTRHPQVQDAAVLAHAGRARRQPPDRLRGDGSGAAGERAAGVPQGRPSRLHGPLGVRAAARAAADPQRQDRPPGAGRAAAAWGEQRNGRPGSPRLRRGGAGGDLERDLRPGRGGERQLLRPRRPLAAGHPPGLAGAGGAGGRAAAAPAVRAADDRRPGRERRGGARRRRSGGGAHRAGPAHRSAPALVQPGAALVPGSAGPRQRGLQHPGGRRAVRAARRGGAGVRPSARWRGGTRRCARPSRAMAASPTKRSRRPVRCRCR